MVAPALTCAANCGVPLSAGAAAGGFDRHPGCEPAVPTTEWRRACVHCDATYTALNATHAVAMTGPHEAYACPGTAPASDDRPLDAGQFAKALGQVANVQAGWRERPGKTPEFVIRSERSIRLERRRALDRAYPDSPV